jgi:predicted lysophospholipase L1 biosynthesis ABC-type transport system permease subunit
MPTAGLNVFDGGRFVLLPLAFVDRTQLIQTGSRVTYRDSYVFDKMPSEQTIDAIQAFIPEQEVENITSERAQREQFFTQLTSVVILALCALVILTYSGLRIVNDMLVRRLLETMRLIRILGTTKRRLVISALLVLILCLLVAFVL